jgi:hypothetical protein
MTGPTGKDGRQAGRQKDRVTGVIHIRRAYAIGPSDRPRRNSMRQPRRPRRGFLVIFHLLSFFFFFSLPFLMRMRRHEKAASEREGPATNKIPASSLTTYARRPPALPAALPCSHSLPSPHARRDSGARVSLTFRDRDLPPCRRRWVGKVGWVTTAASGRRAGVIRTGRQVRFKLAC